MGYRNLSGGAALLAEPGVAEHVIARVARVDGERVDLVVGDDDCVAGRRGFSCLVLPRAGDLVCVFADGLGSHYVTAILERSDPGDLELFSQHPIEIRSASRVKVAAGTTVELDAGERIGLRSPLLDAVVSRVSAVARSLCVTSGEAVLRTRLGKLCAELIDVAAQRIGVTAEHSHRQINGTEQVRCRTFDLRSEVAHVRADAALIKGRDLVKMDSAQIQIG